jgi:cytochrome c oxidase cbb3-type subunit 3
VGYPNLTDDSWQWGSSVDDVTHTVLEGRTAAMPAWRSTLESMGGPAAVDDVTTYVLSLTDKSLLATTTNPWRVAASCSPASAQPAMALKPRACPRWGRRT